MRLPVYLALLAPLLMLGCASAPTSRSALLSAELALEPVRERRDSRLERKLDPALLRNATRVAVPEVSVAEQAHGGEMTTEQAALVANRAGRSLCLRLNCACA